MTGHPEVRITVRVAGEVVDDVKFPIGVGTQDLIGDLGARHGAAAHLADVAGLPYLVDIEFWDGEHVRFGTDRAGMVQPLEVAFERLVDRLTELVGARAAHPSCQACSMARQVGRPGCSAHYPAEAPP